MGGGGDCLHFIFDEASPVPLLPPNRRARTLAERAKDACSENGVEEAMRGQFSDAPPVASEQDVDEEHDWEEANVEASADDGGVHSSGDEDANGEAGEALPKGMWVEAIHSDGYFTLFNNKNQPTCTMFIKDRWLLPPPQGMGATGSKVVKSVGKSKTVTVLQYDASRSDPEICFIILHSWKLWRAEMFGFVDEVSARRCWFNAELVRVQKRIRSLGIAGGGTGCVAADRLIRKWMPRAFS